MYPEITLAAPTRPVRSGGGQAQCDSGFALANPLGSFKDTRIQANRIRRVHEKKAKSGNTRRTSRTIHLLRLILRAGSSSQCLRRLRPERNRRRATASRQFSPDGAGRLPYLRVSGPDSADRRHCPHRRTLDLAQRWPRIRHLPPPLLQHRRVVGLWPTPDSRLTEPGPALSPFKPTSTNPSELLA